MNATNALVCDPGGEPPLQLGARRLVVIFVPRVPSRLFRLA
jgi:hypothetical protein